MSSKRQENNQIFRKMSKLLAFMAREERPRQLGKVLWVSLSRKLIDIW